ncbi:MAG: flavodoxin family protein [Desulfovibrio sp.]|nr:MAG: flavodoxin family protein [Desulfovibrio sp.]
MNILTILAHPNPGSFNHALAHAARDALVGAGHTVTLRDLHAEGFDPLLPFEEIPKHGKVDPVVMEHCTELAEAEGVVIVHPNWWGMPPAILTGWVDRVVRPGVAYEFLENDAGDGVPNGLLKAKTALVLNTSDTYPEREREVFGDPLERIWRDCIFDLCGISDFRRHTFTPVVTSTLGERREWLKLAGELAAQAFPVS